MLTAILVQDFDTLLEFDSLHALLLLLALILFLESSFVFLPLPGDGLVLFVGGLVGIGAIDFHVALFVLAFAAGSGSVIGYLQGRWLSDTRFMTKVEATLPDGALSRASDLLERYGFLSLFGSRFIPFVRVLTPMLMGVSRLSIARTAIISMTSSLTWTLALLCVGSWVMQHPIVAEYQEVLTKYFLMGSLALMISAFIGVAIRVSRSKRRDPASNIVVE
ncbi:DedA family protein [Vibrio sp. WXL103]|uniref:DedA family protein n=1 Tax=Vibrio sp. WXL103 TaxID=3450710 RepID=UPI003EC74F54